MIRKEKEIKVLELKNDLESSNFLIFCIYKGINVESVSKFRSDAREMDLGVKVAKNKLLQVALEGTVFSPISSKLHNQLICIYSSSQSADMIKALKLVNVFAKENEAFTVSSVIDVSGQVFDENQIKALSSLDSMDSVKVRFLGVLLSVQRRFLSFSKASQVKFLRVLTAYMDSQK